MDIYFNVVHEPKGMEGLVHAYFGKGVGKTSRAVGLSLRSLGNGNDVSFVQFLKDGTSSEIVMLKRFPRFTYHCTGTLGFIFDREPVEEEYELAAKGLRICEKASRHADMVVADEILNAVGIGLISIEDVLSLIDRKNDGTELILTGRPGPERILERCQYATKFMMVSHPYELGIAARAGVDY